MALKVTLFTFVTICFLYAKEIRYDYSIGQQFSTQNCVLWHTGVPQEFLKYAITDYLVRDTDLFSLRLSNKKMTTAIITIAVWCELIKMIPIFLSDR